MACTPATREPTRAAAGDTWTWTRTLPEFSAADGWTVAYYVRGTAGEVTSIETGAGDVVATGNSYTVTLPADRTGTLTAGAFRLAGYATRGDERTEIYAGVLVVTPNYAASGAAPALGTDEELLSILTDAVMGRLRDDVAESFTIDGTAITNIPLRELNRMLSEVRARVRLKRTGMGTRSIRVRHGR